MANMNKVRTVWTGVGGAPYYTTHYFSSDNTTGGTEDAVDAVANMWIAMASIISNLLSWTVEGAVPQINDANGALIGLISVPSVSGTGTDTNPLLPRQAQGIVRWDTGAVVNGRMLRGRTFFPGATEARNASGGVPEATYIASLTGNAQNLIDDADSELLVYSRTGSTSAPVVTGTAQPYWATLFSRRD